MLTSTQNDEEQILQKISITAISGSVGEQDLNVRDM